MRWQASDQSLRIKSKSLMNPSQIILYSWTMDCISFSYLFDTLQQKNLKYFWVININNVDNVDNRTKDITDFSLKVKEKKTIIKGKNSTYMFSWVKRLISFPGFIKIPNGYPAFVDNKWPHNSDHTLKTSVYKTPTDNDCYLDQNSNHSI